MNSLRVVLHCHPGLHSISPRLITRLVPRALLDQGLGCGRLTTTTYTCSLDTSRMSLRLSPHALYIIIVARIANIINCSIFLIHNMITLGYFQLPNYPANTRLLYIICNNVGPTSKTLGRRCTNVIQKFCVCWVELSYKLLLLQGLQTALIRDVHPMLGWCWISVTDGVPTLMQHWVNASPLLSYQNYSKLLARSILKKNACDYPTNAKGVFCHQWRITLLCHKGR